MPSLFLYLPPSNSSTSSFSNVACSSIQPFQGPPILSWVELKALLTSTNTVLPSISEVTTGSVFLWVFEFYRNMIFWMLLKFEILSSFHNLSFWVVSQFDFCCMFEILVLSQFKLLSCSQLEFDIILIKIFVNIWFFEFYHNFSC